MLRAGLQGAPASPYNAQIGPHRRFAWADGDLAHFKAIKDALGGTVNDVVLTVVTGALRTHLQANGHEVDGVELKAMVPVSVRAEAERGALGNRVTSMFAPLPVYAADPVERFEIVHEAMKGLKESGQAVGAELLTQLTGFAPPTVLAQASRLQSAAARVQRRRDERARPAVPALHARPQAAADLPAGAAGAQHRARHRDHVLRRDAELRAPGRLRRAARPRRPRRRAARRDRGARRGGRGGARRPAPRCSAHERSSAGC